MQKWVSVEDGLPRINQSVLAVRKNTVTNMAIDKQGFWFTDGYGIEIKSKFDDVTHWMPLPEAPCNNNT